MRKYIFLFVLLVGLSASSTLSHADSILAPVNTDNSVSVVQPIVELEKDLQPKSSNTVSTRYSAQTGIASWYGGYFHGRTTASGARYNMHSMTAAHKTLPFNCTVKVTNHSNGKSTIVKITDRGPFIPGRIIDLSYAAAKEIGVASAGTSRVTLEVLK
jgi:rare lipoprotein A